MLVNPSSLPGHAMGIDMNIEHLIQYLKLVKKRVTNSLRSGYRGSTHTDVDTSALVWRIANKADELGLQSVIADRDINSDACLVVDIFTTGFRKFQTSSLATFNKKIADRAKGSPDQPGPEANEITPCQVVEDGDTDEPEPSEEVSELHED
ncbi:hypothetical protein EDB83DRAFT_2316127 [Lactarius deliciosus]|nr:hypothetical protein EDB83DRAFT_2316127 [Lactarius deliciosus]